jgi:hypothetical protein
MATLVFLEGLWQTGAAQLMNRLKSIQSGNNAFLIHDNLGVFGHARHAPYVIYPLLFRENQVFHGSPIGLKAVSRPSLGIYNRPEISPLYWDEFYRDWIRILKESGHRVIVIYFRPFNSGEVNAFSGIQISLTQEPKEELMVDVQKCSVKKLTELHDLYVGIILEVKRELKKSMQYYQIEYRDVEDAVEALRYEGVLSKTDSVPE